MDIATGAGLAFGLLVLYTMIAMGGDLLMFLDLHAFIVIFGGSTASTFIRFPLSSIFSAAIAIRGCLRQSDFTSFLSR